MTNIQRRLEDVEAKCLSDERSGVGALIGFACLYLAVFAAAFEFRPVLAACVTLCMLSLLPTLLNWYALRIERRVLAKLARKDT